MKLAKHMARGGSFKEWRHKHSNYDNVCRQIARQHGYDSDVYRSYVRSFAIDCIRAVNTNKQHMIEVAEWAADKIA